VGTGWVRDQVENLGTGAEQGQWLTLVPKEFADEAARLFPERCEVLDELVAAAFYEQRCTINDPEEFEDERVLQAIAARVQLEEKGIAPPPTAAQQAARAAALDPGNNKNGIKRNNRKTFADMKAALAVTIHPSRRK
jgi:hypothetical protein